ncbi:sigma-70 family RNA polymerase sigma factor [Singulisphaera sp. PoT]|uniref:sigma-70 family RNA polymerase sigma factor n=1 Tax=Singulisphaera sp. PoT TaxID=3411797 RepID=UPI003BF5400F
MSDRRDLDALFSVGTSAGMSDDELVRQFLERRQESERASHAAEVAFEAIVRRHGPMVLGVCRRYLDDPNDVEDAFQATFIVFFRRVGAFRFGESLGPWLHGVSRRVAARARAVALRERARRLDREVEPATDPEAEGRRRDAMEWLDEELDRLPARYRVPIILYHLEGLTYQEAATRLDCPVGTIGVRLARGRKLLKARLARHGSVLSGAGFLGAVPDPSIVAPPLPAPLVDATLRAVSHGGLNVGTVSASIATLSEGFLRSLFMTRLKASALVFVSLGLLAAGGHLLRQAAARQDVEPAKASQGVIPNAEARAQRARELIYFFRTYQVFSRDEEWARTIRELAAIGKDAVPELIAELDRTDRDATLRSLGFALRAIGDPRAVPALIRAIPKTLRPPGSNCAFFILDRDLQEFMLDHQTYQEMRKLHQSEPVNSGRPVDEILTALESITRHADYRDKAGNDVRFIQLEGSPEQQTRAKVSFEQCQERWRTWWAGHFREFTTQEELQAVEPPKREEDLVEKAGIARYGPLFPTGPGVRLGPVRTLRLSPMPYANRDSSVDFDAGRAFSLFEGMKASEHAPNDERPYAEWTRRNGIDLRQHQTPSAIDLQLWRVDNGRWETIEDEVREGKPLQIGEEAKDLTSPSEKVPAGGELATYLFTTRVGGRGIIQMLPKELQGDRCRLRYRMWESATSDSKSGSAALPGRTDRGGTPFGEVVTTSLEASKSGRECLLDLETGRRSSPPDFLKPEELANEHGMLSNEGFNRWSREQGLDLLACRPEVEGEVTSESVAAQPPKPGAKIHHQLDGLGMTSARISPDAFDDLTLEKAGEILDRTPLREPRIAQMSTTGDLYSEHPDTFVFLTREGTVGLLQMEGDPKVPSRMTIRYRLERRDRPAGR